MPHIEYWRAMPPPALLPISIVLLHSIGNTQKVAFIAFFCLFPVLLNTIDGVRGIDPTLIDTARSYGIPRRERIRRIVLPGGAAADRRRACATSLSLAVIMMVLAEYFSSTNGVGYVLLISKNTFQLGADVGGDPADRPARLPPQPRSSSSPSAALLAWHRGWRAATPQ